MVYKPTETEAVIKLRIPRDLKEWLQARAKEELRPLNSEIILALRNHRERESGESGKAGR